MEPTSPALGPQSVSIFRYIYRFFIRSVYTARPPFSFSAFSIALMIRTPAFLGRISSQTLSRSVTTVRATSKYDALLKGTDPENRDFLLKVLDKAERAADRWTTDASEFSYPPALSDGLLALSRISGVAGGLVWGGYPSSERARLVVGHPDVIATLQDAPGESEAVAAVEVSGNFLFDPATHRDFLGAVLGAYKTVIKRVHTHGDICLYHSS